MTNKEYTNRLKEIVDYCAESYYPEHEFGVTWADENQEYLKQAITAIQQLNNEAIGEDELNPFGKPRINPYSCDECGAPEEPYTRNQLRQELRNILGASNEQS